MNKIKYLWILFCLTVGLLLIPTAGNTETAIDQLATSQPIGDLEVVATFDGAMPAGVTVSQTGRIFVTFPRWGDDVPFTVGEVINDRIIPYPNAEINAENSTQPDALLSVQSGVVDAKDRLWLLDTGRPLFAPAEPGKIKLVGINLSDNTIFKTIVLPENECGNCRTCYQSKTRDRFVV